MPYTTIVTDDVLTASFLNANYRDQVISTVTSATRPSGTAGQVIFETDTLKYMAYDGSGWVEFGKLGIANTYTPTLTATTTSPTLGSGSSQLGRYFKVGRLVVGWFRITFGSSGTNAGSGTYEISVPVAAAAAISNLQTGTGRLAQSGNTAFYPLYVSSATVFRMSYPLTWPSGTATAVGHAAPWAWGAAGELQGQFCYESAA